MIDRRVFLGTLAGGLILAPLAAAAQQTAPRKIGFLGAGTPSSTADRIKAFSRRLGELGWVEGRNVEIIYRWADGRSERFTDLAAELTRLEADVICYVGNGHRRRCKAGDIDHSDCLRSCCRPGRDRARRQPCAARGQRHWPVERASDSGGKRLELIREVAPHLRRVAILVNRDNAGTGLEARQVAEMARQLNLEVTTIETRRAEEIAPAMQALKGHADALIVVADALLNTPRTHINRLALAGRLPTIYGYREPVAAGPLMSYGPDYLDLFRRSAEYVDKILKGAKPAELPVEQPTKFDLVSTCGKSDERSASGALSQCRCFARARPWAPSQYPAGSPAESWRRSARVVDHLAVGHEDSRNCRVAEPGGAADDRVEHRLRVSLRVRDRPQDLTRCGLLLQRLFGLLEQPHVLDGDHGLVGERGDQVDLLVAKRADLSPPQEEQAQQIVLPHHRDREDGSVAGEPLGLGLQKLGVGQHVDDVDGPAFERGPRDRGAPPGSNYIPPPVLLVLGAGAVLRVEPEHLTVELREETALGSGQLHRVLDESLEHRLQLERRAADNLEHFAGRGLPIQGLTDLSKRHGQLFPSRGQLPVACLELLQGLGFSLRRLCEALLRGADLSPFVLDLAANRGLGFDFSFCGLGAPTHQRLLTAGSSDDRAGTPDRLGEDVIVGKWAG